ncbi:aminoglycoside phosphotransferase APH(3') [Dictyobacter sp. S3.2.2.5]|uniref:Aminoglycoside phosphotransferase APH(3') n=1 Tax=Dictyobacter halimunensis TaxID=3026934 RepID=A0ABQ6G1S3_9CHLR|nr:aminoglycoside phosphotransferase APH(3') [Dictyobacter sp. S3.2.2.5]
MMTGANDWQAHLPSSLRDLLEEANWEADELGCSGNAIYRVGPRYLKIAPYQRVPFLGQSALEAEAVRLRWLHGLLPVPHVHYYAHDDQYEFLLISEIAGLVSCDQTFSDRVPEVLRLLAQGLRMLHDVDASGCPFDCTIATRMEQARQYVEQNLIDPSEFNREFQGMSVRDVYELALRLRPQHEKIVLTHGDYCLPNILLDRQLERVTGFIDWGRAGLADPYQDLALAARSLTLNFGEQWVPLLFEAYGLPDPDQDTLRYYRAMDELTFTRA